MVVRAATECSWCYRQAIEGVPAVAYNIAIEGIGGLYDLCQACAEHILGPFALMRAERLVRANRQEELPDGWIGNAWPGATSTVPPPGSGLPGSTVAGRPVRKAVTSAKAGSAGKNGARSGAPPRSEDLLCPFAPASCDHRGVGSFAGVLDHMRRKHDGVTVATLLRHVTTCGLCAPPSVEFATNQHMGTHARRFHEAVLPPAVKHGSWGLALVTAVRRARDPHGTLKAMDAYCLTLGSAQGPNTQLALADSPDSPDDDQSKGDD
jgi:hypothetical protein